MWVCVWDRLFCSLAPFLLFYCLVYAAKKCCKLYNKYCSHFKSISQVCERVNYFDLSCARYALERITFIFLYSNSWEPFSTKIMCFNQKCVFFPMNWCVIQTFKITVLILGTVILKKNSPDKWMALVCVLSEREYWINCVWITKITNGRQSTSYLNNLSQYRSKDSVIILLSLMAMPSVIGVNNSTHSKTHLFMCTCSFVCRFFTLGSRL